MSALILKGSSWQSSRQSSRPTSGVSTPKDGKNAANPKQLAQALRKLSVKPRGIPDMGRYDESRRSSLHDLEARMQRLSSTQHKSMKDLRNSSLKPTDSDSGRHPAIKKQAHFVLPPNKKFDKSPGSSLK